MELKLGLVVHEPAAIDAARRSRHGRHRGAGTDHVRAGLGRGGRRGDGERPLVVEENEAAECAVVGVLVRGGERRAQATPVVLDLLEEDVSPRATAAAALLHNEVLVGELAEVGQLERVHARRRRKLELHWKAIRYYRCCCCCCCCLCVQVHFERVVDVPRAEAGRRAGHEHGVSGRIEVAVERARVQTQLELYGR